MTFRRQARVLFALTAAALVTGLTARAGEPVPADVEVVLSDFEYTPERLALRADQPYLLRFVNRGSGGHNFHAAAFFKSARVDPADAGMVAGGKVEVRKGETVAVRLVPTRGVYPVRCTHFLHATFGMKGVVTVE